MSGADPLHSEPDPESGDEAASEPPADAGDEPNADDAPAPGRLRLVPGARAPRTPDLIRNPSAQRPTDPHERPDWLVGAEEGVTAEHDRTGHEADVRPTLKRLQPGAPDGQDLPIPELELGGPAADPKAARLTLLRPGQSGGAVGAPGAGAKEPAAPQPKKAWTAAGKSLPTLRREAPPARPVPPRETRDAREQRDFDAPTERSLQRSAHAERSAHPERPALPDLPDDRPVAKPVSLPPLREAWWLVAMDELRNNRKIQLGIVALVVAWAAYTFWPRREPTVSIADLQRHAREYDGRAVTVRGRVGDVYHAGEGYTFYLQQGGETIVVFTRTRVPVPNETISVKGTISTGYLDGAPHQSLFESQ